MGMGRGPPQDGIAEPESNCRLPKGARGMSQRSPVSATHPTGCFRLCILTCMLRLHGSSGGSARALVLRISSLFSAADYGRGRTDNNGMTRRGPRAFEWGPMCIHGVQNTGRSFMGRVWVEKPPSGARGRKRSDKPSVTQPCRGMGLEVEAQAVKAEHSASETRLRAQAQLSASRPGFQSRKLGLFGYSGTRDNSQHAEVRLAVLP